MLFSSITFLYLFLPFTILLYFFVPQKGRNLVLLAMSLLFYAWGEPVYVLLMLAQIVISYVLLWFVDRFRGRKSSRNILYSVCSFAVCGIILLQIFSVFYGCGVWHQDKDDRASNRDFVLHISDCKLLCRRVPRQGSAAEKSCHLCGLCDAVSAIGSRADCALQRD